MNLQEKTINPRIQKKKETSVRHKKMHRGILHLKISKNKLSRKQKYILYHLFTQAKWFTNYCISQNINKADTTLTSIIVKVQDKSENREINLVSSQMRQGIKTRLQSNLKSLKTKKDKGQKVGKINYITECSSIPLKQYNVTYKINFDKNKIKLQGINFKIPVKGLNQITKLSDKDIEFANAIIIAKGVDFHFNVTYYTPNPPLKKKQKQTKRRWNWNRFRSNDTINSF
jgi:putative transposase